MWSFHSGATGSTWLHIGSGLTTLVNFFRAFDFSFICGLPTCLHSPLHHFTEQGGRAKGKGKALLFVLCLVPLVGDFLLFFPFSFPVGFYSLLG